MFHVIILTIFPEMLPGSLQYSLNGKALKNKIWSYDVINIRDFGITKHKNIDDTQYGGGDGLVMRADVLGNALDYAVSLHGKDAPIYYPSPRGAIFNQLVARKIVQKRKIIMLCGRFEGIDQRVIDEFNVIEISLGDFILSGGEVAAISILDACIRLIPGVVINKNTLLHESFELENNMLLENSLYTKPHEWRGRRVPDVLLSGNHQLIKKWKQEERIKITSDRRPDILNKII